MKVLVTGANGFIGRHLLACLLEKGHRVTGAVRSTNNTVGRPGLELVNTGDIDGDTNWSPALQSVDCVVHLAGLAHVFDGKQAGDLDAFRRVNVAGTLNLARQAAHAGVSKFIFLSSIGVLGTKSTQAPFSNNSPVIPEGAYAISKAEAERALNQEFAYSRMPVVIIRPPLVYGADAPGNFRRLVRLVNSGIPLPFGRLHNVRSMISVNNLSDFIATCVESAKSENQTFAISDGSDWSVSQLVSILAENLKRNSRLVSVPPKVLSVLATAAGQRESLERLSAPLEVSSADSWQLMDWKPPYNPAQELEIAVCGWSAGSWRGPCW